MNGKFHLLLATWCLASNFGFGGKKLNQFDFVAKTYQFLCNIDDISNQKEMKDSTKFTNLV